MVVVEERLPLFTHRLILRVAVVVVHGPVVDKEGEEVLQLGLPLLIQMV
jgi:hypothetical protein